MLWCSSPYFFKEQVSVATRKPALLITLGTAIAFITGGGAAYWWFNRQSAPSGPVNLPVGAEVIPNTALITLSFSTDAQQWRELRSFGTPESQAQVDQLLAQWRDRWLTSNQLDYQSDIQPWIGSEMTVAVLPPDDSTAEPPAAIPPDPSPGEITDPSAPSPATPDPSSLVSDLEDQDLIAILPIADPLQAQQTLEQSMANSTVSQEQDYEGITLREITPDGGTSYATAVVENRFVAIAPSMVILQQMIDAYRNDTALDDQDAYRETVRQAASDRPFLRAYVNIAAAQALPGDVSPANQWLSFSRNQGMAATVTLEAQGIRLQTSTWRSLEPDAPMVRDDFTDIATLLPDSTLMMVSGSNLKSRWQQYSSQATQTNTSGTASNSLLHPDSIRQGIQSATGLDIDRDWMNWMSGEFAVGLIPMADDTAPNGTSVGLVVIAKASDRQAAETTFTALEEVMTSRHRFEVTDATIADTPVKQWTQPLSGLTVVRGWLDGDRAFLALRASVAETILPAPETPLTATSLYQTLTSNNSDTTGQFFVNLESVFSDQSGLPVPAIPGSYGNYLNAIQSISVTLRSHNSQTSLYDTFVILRKGNSPGPLPDVTDVPPTPSPGDSPAAPQ